MTARKAKSLLRNHTITITIGPRMTAFIIRTTAMVGGLIAGAFLIHFVHREVAFGGALALAKIGEVTGAALADAIFEVEEVVEG